MVCQTNKATDGFIADLLDQGITDIVRLGQGSSEDWTGQYNIRNLRNNTLKNCGEEITFGETRGRMISKFRVSSFAIVLKLRLPADDIQAFVNRAQAGAML